MSNSILDILRGLKGGRVYTLNHLSTFVNDAFGVGYAYTNEQIGEQARKVKSCLKKIGRGKYVTKGRIVKGNI